MSPTLELTRPIAAGPRGYPRILAVAAERIEAFFGEPEGLPSLAVSPAESGTHFATGTTVYQ